MVAVSIFFAWVVVLLAELHLVGPLFSCQFLCWLVNDGLQDKLALSGNDYEALIRLSVLS